MKPKEKATELLNKFNNYHDKENKKYIIFQTVEESKRCALIAVNEIIEACYKLNFTVLHSEYGQKLIDINGEIKSHYTEFVVYWNLVKQEIEKL